MLQLEQEIELPKLTDRWMSVAALQTAMINAGLNIFVNDHSEKYTSTCTKVRVTVLCLLRKIRTHSPRFTLSLPAGPPHGARRLRTDGSLCLCVCLLVEQVECKLRLRTSSCAGRLSPTNPTAGCNLTPYHRLPCKGSSQNTL